MTTMSDTIGWAKPEDVGLSRERLARIGEVFGADIDRGLLPGAVTLVARHGRIVHFKAFGRRDPARDDAMERDAIFRIYSMTKPVVSVALMRFVEEGLISLADPLHAYLPEFRHMEVLREVEGRIERRPATREITLHDLMRHMAGLIYGWDDGPVARLYAKAELGARTQDSAEQVRRLAGLPLAAEPGTRWEYSHATDVLGRVLEILSGDSLGAHLAARIFAPIGMPDTGFHVRASEHGRLAEPWPVDPGTGEAVSLMEVRTPPTLESGGGGLVSTASDYARFLHMLLSGGVLDSERLLSPRTITYMTADHLPPGAELGSDILPDGYGFGLGLAVRRQDGLAAFPGSAGDVFWEGLAGTSFWIDPSLGLYALIMVQAPGRRAHYRRLMRQLVYGAVTD